MIVDAFVSITMFCIEIFYFLYLNNPQTFLLQIFKNWIKMIY
jgi:hypothetical protein